ncbi:MAG TPA: hypothetical protein VJV79_05775 [Polyangiaceae bacterium]|nr:hypothetical protein [Polyangiaceae bacterium]
MSLRYSSAFVLASSLALSLLSVACSAGPSDSSNGRIPVNGGGAGPVTGNGGSGNTLIVDNGGKTGADPNDKRDIPMREKICDATGKCTCLHLALLGTLTSAADAPDTTAFTNWLSSKSDGSAVATIIPTKPTVDAAFLANYDILLVANVNGWTFSADEKAAVQTWVEAGGGIITLTGFVSAKAGAQEAADTSQLISFAGLQYTGTSEAQYAAPAIGETSPVYYKGGNVDLKLCMNWNGGPATTAAKPFVTTPIKFTPQTDSLEKLTANLDYVGAFIGWPITAPADAKVIAKDPVNGGNMAVAKEVNGKGRIFAFGDEWVTFTNLWEQAGTPSNPTRDMYNPCYVAASGTAAEFFHSVQTLYQTKQFWYNAINWVAPPNGCFTIVDPDVITVVK